MLPSRFPSGLTGEEGLDREVLSMGTTLGIHLEGAPRVRLQGTSSLLLEEVERIERACSLTREDSAWSRLNRAGGRTVNLADEWLELLERVGAWRDGAGGAFDPVLLALGRVGAAGQGTLAEARQASGFSLLRLDRSAGTARLAHPGAGLDGGGFIKGYALDAALKVARAQGVPSGWLDFGGQLLTWGRSRAVRVAAPGDRLRPRLALTLPEGASLSSSGCSERGRHLLDPRSGCPCPDWGAVAAVGASGLEAELLSTTLYVLGPDQGPPWAEAQGAAAAFLPHGGGVLATSALSALDPVPVRP